MTKIVVVVVVVVVVVLVLMLVPSCHFLHLPIPLHYEVGLHWGALHLV